MKKILFNKNFILSVLVISFLYYVILMVLTNKDLFLDLIFSSFLLENKIKLFFLVLFGWVSIKDINFLLLVSVSLLTGVKLTLLFQKFKNLSRRKEGLFSGGSTMVGMVGSGCVVVCSATPFFFTASLAGGSILLPLFENLKYLSPIFLSLSLYFILKNYKEVCKLD